MNDCVAPEVWDGGNGGTRLENGEVNLPCHQVYG